jgi:site-specific DNA recombinase
MRAVIYARYSSDLQRDASIEDQLSLCSARAEREGWTIVRSYTDRAASGADVMNRTGIKTLLADAKARQFDIVLSEALDRVSRDQEDIAAIYKRLRHYDISVVTLAEGKVDELHIGLKGTMNALFLKDLASKIRRGQRGRIMSGFSAGGLSYGYKVVRELDDEGNFIRGKRSVNDEEAAVVRRIFTEYASGKSPRRIAAELNADRIPSPRGGQWNASTINGHRGRRNGILQNELYKGLLIHNRVRMVKDPDTGRRISRVNHQGEWVSIEVPELRIVSDELWGSVQQTRRGYRGQAAQNCRRPKRLLSGLLTCGECGGAFTLVRPGKYGCSTHREKGTCTNASQISVNQLEGRVLAGIKMRLLDPELLAEFVHEFHSELERVQAASTEVGSHSKKRLNDIKQKIARIVGAISEGTDTPALRQALLSLEGEKAELEKTVAVHHRPILLEPPPAPELARLFRRKVERLEETLNAEPTLTSKAAPILRTLIDGIVLHPRKKRGTMPIEVYGEPSALFLLANDEMSDADNWMITVVAEEGLEPPTRGL